MAGESTACRLLPGMKESPLRGMESLQGVRAVQMWDSHLLSLAFLLDGSF